MPQIPITTRNVALALGAMLFIAFLGPATGAETFFYRDFGVLGYPTASYHREMFWRGELPLWNPYSNCGVPFLAQWGTMVLYPFSLIYLLLPFPWSLNIFCLLHLWFGALGVFKLARRWTESNEGAAVASVLFLFSGITLSSLSWPNYTAAFGWTPWLILFAEAAWRGRQWAVARAALVGTMQMLAGVPELTMLTWALIGALWLRDGLATPRIFKWFTLRLAILVGLIAALSAAQLMPFFDLLWHSHRLSGGLAHKWALPMTGLPNFILPMLHAFQTPQGTWFQYDQHFLSSTYVGAFALMLAIAGVLSRQGRAVLLAIFSALCIAASLSQVGGQSFGLARYPVKFLLLLPVTIPLLAAFGFRARLNMRLVFGIVVSCAALLVWAKANPFQYDRWPETLSNSIVRMVLFGLAVFLLRRRWTAALCILLFVDGRYHIANQNPTTRVATVRSAIGTRPLPKLGEGRAFISADAEKALLNSNVRDLSTEFIGKQLAIWSHLNLVELAPKVNGSATLQIREQKEIQSWLYSGTNSNLEAWLDFLGVTHATRPDSVVEWTNRRTALPMLRVAAPINPMRYLAGQVESNADLSFPRVIRPEFDPLKETLLDYSSDPPQRAEAEIKNLKVSEHEVTADVFASGSTTLVFAQSWSPNWRAEVNGQPWRHHFDLMHANHVFGAFTIPEGKSRVRIYYRDNAFILGGAISIVALLITAWMLRRDAYSKT